MLPPEGALKTPCLLGSLSHLVDDFDWGESKRPRHPLERLNVYELDIPGFTTGTGAGDYLFPFSEGKGLLDTGGIIWQGF